MSKYYHAKRDGKYHYEGLDTSKEAMPLETLKKIITLLRETRTD